MLNLISLHQTPLLPNIGPIQISDNLSVIIREFKENDATALAKIIQHQQFSFFAFPAANTLNPKSAANIANNYVQQCIVWQQPNIITGQRENYKLAIVNAQNNQMLGYVAFDEVNENRGEKRDIGYFVDPAYQKQGVARKVMPIFLENVVPLVPKGDIWATVHPNNTPSQCVLKYLHFENTDDTCTNAAGEPRLIFKGHTQYFMPK